MPSRAAYRSKGKRPVFLVQQLLLNVDLLYRPPNTLFFIGAKILQKNIIFSFDSSLN
jgi:hypothetical protein